MECADLFATAGDDFMPTGWLATRPAVSLPTLTNGLPTIAIASAKPMTKALIIRHLVNFFFFELIMLCPQPSNVWNLAFTARPA
jgi:hypothetical protein